MVIERGERSRAGEIRQSVMKLNLAQNNMATLCASTPSPNQERKESHWLNAGKKGIYADLNISIKLKILA